MSKKMLINATHPEENRVAIVEDGILTELDIEIAGKEQTKGNIYKAAVVRVESGLQAAFIDYGGERFGFLQIGEIHPSYFPNGEGESRGRRIGDVLRRGQELLVQVVKEERGTKGAALTTFLSLPGRFMVLMPDSDTKGVSRKIEEESQRKKLKEAMASLDLPGQMGYIVRTAGIGQKKEELRRDFNYLVRVYEKIQDQARQAKAPSLIYKESNLVIRSLRDYFSSDMDEVLVDDPRVYQEAKDFFQEVMPEFARLVKLHQEKRPIFARYQIEEQIETITKNKVLLPSGGSIVIDSTEALVAVDVNSGKMAGETNVEATAYKSNLEAATETARQLRLRDLGGLIVIDFIDMRDRKHIREVEKRLKDSLKYDKARVTVGRISQFGLLEMSRQRIKATLAEGSYLPCPHCYGSGKVKSAEAQAIAFLRKVHGAIAKGQIGRVEGEIPLEVATYLLNFKREELLEMERQHQMVVVIKGRPDFLPGQAELTTQKREKEEFASTEAFSLLPPLQPSPVLAAPLPAAEAPERPTAEPSAETTAEPSSTEAEAEGRKKRKRKRKKKKPEEIVAGLDSAIELEVMPEPQAGADAPLQAEASTPDEVDETALTGETEAGGERKKKRRRRRKKKTPQEGVATEAEPGIEPFSEPSPAPASDAAPALEAETESGELSEKEGKSRRRRRKRKPAAVAPIEAPTPVAASADPPKPEITVLSDPGAPAPTAPDATADSEPAVNPEAKPKRSPRPRKRPAAAPVTEELAESGSTVDPLAKAEPEPQPAAKSKPARRPRTVKKATDEAPAAAETTQAAGQETPMIDPAAKAPPKRRSPRKKTTPKKEEQEFETPAE